MSDITRSGPDAFLFICTNCEWSVRNRLSFQLWQKLACRQLAKQYSPLRDALASDACLLSTCSTWLFDFIITTSCIIIAVCVICFIQNTASCIIIAVCVICFILLLFYVLSWFWSHSTLSYYFVLFTWECVVTPLCPSKEVVGVPQINRKYAGTVGLVYWQYCQAHHRS